MKQRNNLILRAALLLAASTLALQPACATTWASLTSATSNSVTGSLNLGSQTIGITYTGEIDFTQLNNAGTNFYTPAATYVGGPTTTDMIAISGSTAVHTFTFSSPLVNPEIAIVSLGQPGDAVSYNFDAPFTIVSQGAGNPYGGCNTCLSVSSDTRGGDSLTGREGDGIIEFNGTYSSLSFTVTNAEYWNGFTIGAAGAASSTASPEPASIGLIGLAFVGFGAAIARKRRK